VFSSHHIKTAFISQHPINKSDILEHPITQPCQTN